MCTKTIKSVKILTVIRTHNFHSQIQKKANTQCLFKNVSRPNVFDHLKPVNIWTQLPTQLLKNQQVSAVIILALIFLKIKRERKVVRVWKFKNTWYR